MGRSLQMLKVAIYGKGGIGKSTVTSNLAAAFASMGKKVIQIGCDPKADSTINLLGGEPLRPVMNYMREEDEEPETLEDISREGFGGVLCIETGGPTPGLGCAGRGIIATFQLLEDLRLFETYRPDVVLYDVLGDVVCGGVAAPIREGYAEKVLIVTSGETMACGRNTSLTSTMREYDNRFFYLMMDETDIVTGRHLKKIPKAVAEICEGLEKKPSVVMICITCVDALLGTDMERICRKAEEKAGLPVRPCYMYALTREGRKPPMVHVRQSLYSLLEPAKKKGNVVNILGFFSPLVDDCELYELLHGAGIKTIHEISRCRAFEEYKTMSEANFNLVLHQESRFVAEDLSLIHISEPTRP